MADSAANEGDAALAVFAGSWAVAWRAGQIGTETLHARAGSTNWTVGPYRPGPVGDRPALAPIDNTHILVLFTEGTDPIDSGVSNGSKLRVALLDTASPGLATAIDVPSGGLFSQSQPNAVRVGDTIYLAWRSQSALDDPNGEELWIKALPTALTPSGLDLSGSVRPLPRVTSHRVGDQRRPALAAGSATAFGEIIASYEDWGGNFGASRHQVVAVEVIPSPILRLGEP